MEQKLKSMLKNMELMLSIDQKNHQKIEQCLHEGADPNFVYSDEANWTCTPLYTAIHAKDPASIEILLRSGAKPDTTNNDGISPWDLAHPHPELKAVFEKHLRGANALPVAEPGEQPQSRNLQYDRRTGTSAISGQLYEVDLLGLVLSRLRKGGYEFLIGTNIDGIGEFDDLCIRYRRAGEENFKFIFLQAKHREDPDKKKITTELLNLTYPANKANKKERGNQNYEYSIYKLFSSYLKIRQRFLPVNNDVFFSGDFESSDVELVLYTNAHSDCKSVDSIQCNDLLKTGPNGKGFKVQLSKEILRELYTMCYDKSNKDAFDQICREEDILNEDRPAEDYIKKLKIYYHQGNAKDVGKILEKELQDGSSENSQTLYLMYHNQVQEYWLSANEYLTESCQIMEIAKQKSAHKLLENLSSIFSSDAKSYQLEYREEALECPELDAFHGNPDEQFFNVHSKAAKLSFVKVSQYFEQRSSDSHAMIDFDKVYYIWSTVYNQFRDLNKFNNMIVYCVERKSQLQEILRNISAAKGNHKIIIVSDEPLREFQYVLDTRNGLAYLTPECQTKITNSKEISFQNKPITLTDLMNGVKGQLKWNLISGEILLNTLLGNTVEIAKLSAERVPYFIQRQYVIGQINLKSNTYNFRWYHEDSKRIDSVDSFDTRNVIIAAEPGMGKSTILTHLSSNSDFIWIVRFNLLDYCKQLGKIDLKQSKLKVAMAFLLGTLELPAEIFKISDAGFEQNDEQYSTLNDLKLLEANVFKCCYNLEQIVVLADGFDEIAPHYVEATLHILEGLKESKIRKLIVTTRNINVKTALEERLGVVACCLCPFTRDDVEEFCKLYWKTNLNIKDFNDHRARKFCGYLIDNCRKSISTDVFGFIGVPLHIEMIARCVQDTFANYHRNEDWQYIEELKSEMNIVSLYRNFIKTKYDEIFCIEKLQTDPAKPPNRISAEESQKKHERLALYALFRDEELEIMLPEYKSKRPEDLQSIEADKENKGFVIRVVDDNPQFAHLTFAEFFAAEILWKTFKETAFEQFKTFVEVVLIENLLKNGREQIFQFLIELARQNSANYVDTPMKTTLLLKRILTLSRTTDLSLLLELTYCCCDAEEFWQLFDKLEKSIIWSFFELCVRIGHSKLLRAMIGRISQNKMKNKLANSGWNQSPLHMATLKADFEVMRVLVNEFGYDMKWQDRRNRTFSDYLLEMNELSTITDYVKHHNFEISQILGENIPTQLIEEFVRSNLSKLFKLNNYVPNISWYILKSRTTLSELDKFVGFSQIFLFENCSRRDSVYHNDDYFDTLLSSYLFSYIDFLNEIGDGFYLEIIAQIQKWIVILRAVSIELEDSLDRNLAWLKFIIAEANEVSLKVEENGKIKISNNNKYIDATRWITNPEKVQSSNDIDYITRTLNLPNHSLRTEQFKSLMTEITNIGAEDLFFRYLSSTDFRNQESCQNEFSRCLQRLKDLRDKYSNLLASIDRGETEVLAALGKLPTALQRKTVINCRDKKFGSPLLYATACQKLKIAQALLKEGANPKIRLELVNDASFDDLDEVFSKVKEFGNVTPLHIAAFLGNLEFVELLRSADPRKFGVTPFNRGALLEVSTPYTPLHLAARQGHENVVRYLLEEGARIDAVVDEDHCEEFPFPVRNTEGGRSTPLSLAEKYGHRGVVDLLKSFQPTEENGFTALHRAAASNDLDSTRILIQTGDVYINSVTRCNGYTPLHVAAENNHMAVAHLLVRKGANKDAKTFKGKTPVQVAEARGYVYSGILICSFVQSNLGQIFEPDYKKVMEEEGKEGYEEEKDHEIDEVDKENNNF